MAFGNELDLQELQRYKEAQFKYLCSKTIIENVKNIGATEKPLGKEVAQNITEVLKIWNIQQHIIMSKETATTNETKVLGLEHVKDFYLSDKDSKILQNNISEFVTNRWKVCFSEYNKISNGEISKLMSETDDSIQDSQDKLSLTRNNLLQKYRDLLDSNRQYLNLQKLFLELRRDIFNDEVNHSVELMKKRFEEVNVKAKTLHLRILNTKYTEVPNGEHAFKEIIKDIKTEVEKRKEELAHLHQEKSMLLSKIKK